MDGWMNRYSSVLVDRGPWSCVSTQQDWKHSEHTFTVCSICMFVGLVIRLPVVNVVWICACLNCPQWMSTLHFHNWQWQIFYKHKNKSLWYGNDSIIQIVWKKNIHFFQPIWREYWNATSHLLQCWIYNFEVHVLLYIFEEYQNQKYFFSPQGQNCWKDIFSLTNSLKD